MNLEQWQRSKKIKAEAEAAAKRTVERVLNTIKEPAMSEFEGKSGKWAWEIQKEQQANLVELRSSIENLVQKYKHDAHASSLFGDQDKARVYNCFANQLEHLLKGGA
ncbi:MULTISPECIES: hypothetical protein [Acinetobacter calcoaceticus/baumannii complex]|nr:hypothetical protein [Acinetobacter sp. 1264765]